MTVLKKFWKIKKIENKKKSYFIKAVTIFIKLRLFKELIYFTRNFL